MRYSLLRFKPVGQLVLFVLTAGLLAYLAQRSLWVWFWSVLGVAVLLQSVLVYLDSAAFLQGLRRLRDKEFRLAARFDRIGAEDIFLMADPVHQVERNKATQRILRDGHRFSLVTLTASSYIDPAVDRHWQLVDERLASGCGLRLLLQDPWCAEKQIRDQRNHPDGRPDTKFDLPAVLSLAERYPDQVRIRLTSANIYCAIFFSDESLTYDPYHLGLQGPRAENRFFTMLFHKPQPGTEGALDHYSLLASHFEYLWSTLSTDLPDFLRSRRTELNAVVSPVMLADIDRFLTSVSR